MCSMVFSPTSAVSAVWSPKIASFPSIVDYRKYSVYWLFLCCFWSGLAPRALAKTDKEFWVQKGVFLNRPPGRFFLGHRTLKISGQKSVRWMVRLLCWRIAFICHHQSFYIVLVIKLLIIMHHFHRSWLFHHAKIADFSIPTWNIK